MHPTHTHVPSLQEFPEPDTRDFGQRLRASLRWLEKNTGKDELQEVGETLGADAVPTGLARSYEPPTPTRTHTRTPAGTRPTTLEHLPTLNLCWSRWSANGVPSTQWRSPSPFLDPSGASCGGGSTSSTMITVGKSTPQSCETPCCPLVSGLHGAQEWRCVVYVCCG